MVSPGATPVLLALDAGVRETGWAIFRSGRLATSGNIGAPHRGRMGAHIRVSHLLRCLDDLVAEWQPGTVAYSQPSGIHWPVPALEFMEVALVTWAKRHGLDLYTYTAQEVRAAIAGHPNVSRDRLAYGVMARLALIGQRKTTHEWEAIAVGDYHLQKPSSP